MLPGICGDCGLLAPIGGPVGAEPFDRALGVVIHADLEDGLADVCHVSLSNPNGIFRGGVELGPCVAQEDRVSCGQRDRTIQGKLTSLGVGFKDSRRLRFTEKGNGRGGRPSKLLVDQLGGLGVEGPLGSQAGGFQ